jgi:hypothetical protein
MQLTQKQIDTILNGIRNYEAFYYTDISYQDGMSFYYISGNMHIYIDLESMTIDYTNTNYIFDEMDLEETMDFWGDWQ